MRAMASQITMLTIVYSNVYAGTDQRKHQSSASLAFVRGIRRWPENSRHKGPVTRKMFFYWWRHYVDVNFFWIGRINLDPKLWFQIESTYSVSQDICTRFLLCCALLWLYIDFPISIRLTSLALWQSNDCPSASKATLMNMDKYFMWIHYERLHNHNKAKHNKTVYIFLGIYCTSLLWDLFMNTLRPRQNGRQIPDNFKCIFLNENM